MSDEFVNVKYSNRNAPSLIFNSFVSIFSIYNHSSFQNLSTKKLTISSESVLLKLEKFEFPINLERLPKG